MVVIVLPKWYIDAEEKIKETILNIAIENEIPLNFVEDSKSIEDAKDTILNSLVRIDENVSVEERKRLKEFAKSIDETDRPIKNSESKIPPTEA